MKKMFFLMLTFFVLGVATMSAQVRISGTIDPHDAAVLDLNVENTGTPARNKGALALPRITLNTATDQLNGATPLNGMLVYNTGRTLKGAGVYVWKDGKWSKMDDCPPAVDYEGNAYPAKRMGDGQCWMTRNLRSAVNSTGQAIDSVVMNPGLYGGVANGAVKITWDGGSVVYKKGTSSVSPADGSVQWSENGVLISNKSYDDFANKFGFLYSWSVAQSVCPNGWRLPDWYEFYNVRAIGDVGDNGTDLMSNTVSFTPGNSTTVFGWGNTNPEGFNALPSGSVNSNGTNAREFGEYARWWVGYQSDIDLRYANVWIQSGVGTIGKEVELFSGRSRYGVRCVKQ